MKLRGLIPSPRSRPAVVASSLVELLVSMGILSVLLVVMGSALEVALGRFRAAAETVEKAGDFRVAVSWLERDLASAVVSRPARLPRLPGRTTAVQREFFEGAIFLPFEIDRVHGRGLAEARSFQNAAPGFASLAFVTAGDGEGPAIAGYYVAYARSSPLTAHSAAGMKLFRHFRRGGNQTGDGYAGGLILSCSYQINDAWDEAGPGLARPAGRENPAALRGGRFENADLPFLLAWRFTDPLTISPVPATAPWPANPVREWLVAPPPDYEPARGSAAQWADPGSPVHHTVFPDEAVCDHVVKFELRPRRRVTLADGRTELMAAAALNRHLGLAGGEEWPVLVAPDSLEMTLGTISEKVALTLTKAEDWIIDFSLTDPGSWSPQRRLIERELQLHRLHLSLPPRVR